MKKPPKKSSPANASSKSSIAPSYSPAAPEMLKDRWERLPHPGNRFIGCTARPDATALPLRHRRVHTRPAAATSPASTGAACTVTSIRATPAATPNGRDLEFIWLATKHRQIQRHRHRQKRPASSPPGAGPDVSSHVRQNRHRTRQQERPRRKLRGSVAGSDAFFPSPTPRNSSSTPASPPSSTPAAPAKDQETIDLNNGHNIALVITGQRHFAH